MSINALLERLQKVKRRGEGQYMACCPAHEDSEPSLAITTAQNGNILIHCFAGCEPVEILDAVGLEMGALFDDDFLDKHKKLIHFEQQQRRVKQTQIKPLSKQETDQLILAEAQRKRESGEKLTERDMNLELEAFMRQKGKAS